MTNYRLARFGVFAAAGLAATCIFGFALLAVPGWYLRIIRLTEWYAFAALISLYITLLIAPFSFTFRTFPFRAQLFAARRAFGLSSFGFAVLHGSFAFFGQLGGFPGLAFLSGVYVPAVILGFGCFVILLVLASTASDAAQKRLGFRRWKLIHRFVYLAGVLLVIHVLIIGTHFGKLNAAIPVVSFAALAVLLLLEARRADARLRKKWPGLPRFGICCMTVLCLSVFYIVALAGAWLPAAGIHSNHAERTVDFDMAAGG